MRWVLSKALSKDVSESKVSGEYKWYRGKRIIILTKSRIDYFKAWKTNYIRNWFKCSSSLIQIIIEIT